MNKALGGTELMYNELERRLDPELFNKFSIFNYACYADFNKPTIYWNQLSYDQEAVQFLKDIGYVDKIDHFVFVSHWQAEQYRKLFNIPGYKSHVIKNACLGVTPNFDKSYRKLKICFTSTPWRGLNVLLKAWEILNPSNCELHVFSGTKIYGDDFYKNTDSIYTAEYDRCKELNNVVYRGNIDNEDLRSELSEFHILAYPCTFEETSCISVIDALSAGLRVVTSSIGALPETTEGWANIYGYYQNPDYHAEEFARVLKNEIETYEMNRYSLELQSKNYYPRWCWGNRIKEWENLLKTIQ